MKIIELTKKDQLNDFVLSQKHNQLLQSWEWGEFQKKFGNKIFRFGLEREGQIKFALQLIKKSLPFGKAYFYAPRVVVKNLSEEELKFFFNKIDILAKKENIIFLRYELTGLKIQNSKFKILKTIDIQAKKTLILGISGSEEEILNSMHQKTRYNIRLAKKRGVMVREGSENDFENFWKIMEETSARDGFRLHSKNYYQEMIKLENVKLLIAEYEDKIIAGVILSFFGDMGSYIHGASANEYRNMMAPHVLQWEAIRLSRTKGCDYYDFNGIDEKKWPGVTKFKIGFGGETIEYPGTFDLVFSYLWYNIYKVVRKIRRIM